MAQKAYLVFFVRLVSIFNLPIILNFQYRACPTTYRRLWLTKIENHSVYSIDPVMCGSLKRTEKSSGTAKFIMEGNDRLNGYKCAVSFQVTAGDIFF